MQRRGECWRPALALKYCGEPHLMLWMSFTFDINLAHTTTGCGEQGFPSAQPYLSHTPVG
ncbi:hypothetical protein BJX64DRAFT_66132 [Aspergillus heterothallicus]